MKIYFYIISFCLITISLVYTKAQAPAEDDAFKALNDEMQRSLKELKLDTFKAPFFVAYYLSEGTNFSAQSRLGALVRSKETPIRGNNYRLMVGSYELNDENFRGSTQSYNSGGASLSLPIFNDYSAIRRCFWSMSDRSYKNAIDSYNQKLTALKQQNSDDNEKMNDYNRMAPVSLIMESIPVKYDKALWENNIKDLSAVFRNYPKIQNSVVNIYILNSVIYLVNSEGSKVKYTNALACLTVNANTQAKDGEDIRDQLTYYAPLNEQLPSIAEIKKDVIKIAESLEVRYSTAPIDEPFQGPVVFEGEALAELFNYKLFGWNGLLTSREPVYAVDAKRAASNKMENKIGKRICAENISIVSSPKTKSFGKIPLMGSYELDGECVTPVNDLVLVDKGILKTQLTDRVPTKKVKESNGSVRFNIWGGYSKAPGVIKVNYDKGQNYASFLKTVSSEAERSGLEYYYIIRKMETVNMAQYIQAGNSGLTKPIGIYKVSVKTGKETLVRSAIISEFPMLSFKYVVAGTSEQEARNTSYGNSLVVSYIIPKAIAFNDVSIEKDNTPKSKLPIVESPLVAGK
jgi:hypothetical protein